MTYDVYSTAELIGLYGIIDKPSSFLYDVFFRDAINFDTRQVFFDRVDRARRLAPLVSPEVEGKAQKIRGYETLSFAPAYVKPKHVINPTKMFARRAGEALTGSLTPEQRRQLIIADCVAEQNRQISRREEYMAAQLLLTGAVTVSSEDFPQPQSIDMVRPAGNTVSLAGTASAWGQPGVDALEDLNIWSSYVQQVSGFPPRVVVMSPTAFTLFRKSPGVIEVMNSFRQLTGYVNLADYPVGGVGNEAALMGTFGQFEIWSYQSFYTDANGNVQQMMPDNTVIMGDPIGCGGTRLYGAIQDMNALVPASRFPTMWRTMDPSAEVMMTQSAPLPVLGWAQATFAATVA